VEAVVEFISAKIGQEGKLKTNECLMWAAYWRRAGRVEDGRLAADAGFVHQRSGINFGPTPA
jgi:hypothetical protein